MNLSPKFYLSQEEESATKIGPGEDTPATTEQVEAVTAGTTAPVSENQQEEDVQGELRQKQKQFTHSNHRQLDKKIPLMK